jgi:hypothetical protein
MEWTAIRNSFIPIPIVLVVHLLWISRMHLKRKQFPSLLPVSLYALNQGQPETRGHPHSLNHLALLKNWYSLNYFGLRQGWQKVWGTTPKLQIIFREILMHVESWVYQHDISNYSSDGLAPLTGWHPSQLPSWSAPYYGPALNIRLHILTAHPIQRVAVNKFLKGFQRNILLNQTTYKPKYLLSIIVLAYFSSLSLTNSITLFTQYVLGLVNTASTAFCVNRR